MSRELREIFGQRAANFAGKKLIHRRNRPSRLIEGNALDAIHWKKDGGQPDAFAVRLIELADKMVERIQIDPAQRHARRINVQQLAPNLLFRRMQTQHNDRMWIHRLGANSVPLQSTGIAFGWGTSCRIRRYASFDSRGGSLLRKRRGIAIVFDHQRKTSDDNEPAKPSQRIGSAAFVWIIRLPVRKQF